MSELERVSKLIGDDEAMQREMYKAIQNSPLLFSISTLATTRGWSSETFSKAAIVALAAQSADRLGELVKMQMELPVKLQLPRAAEAVDP